MALIGPLLVLVPLSWLPPPTTAFILRHELRRDDRAPLVSGWTTSDQISQQVAKNLFLWPGRSFIRKAIEAYLTVELELVWSKRRILEMYLNIAEFGDGVFGIGSASERSFGKTPAEITEAEAAVLPSPSRLHADRPTVYLRERQAWIRRQMRQLRADGLPARFN